LCSLLFVGTAGEPSPPQSRIDRSARGHLLLTALAAIIIRCPSHVRAQECCAKSGGACQQPRYRRVRSYTTASCEITSPFYKSISIRISNKVIIGFLSAVVAKDSSETNQKRGLCFAFDLAFYASRYRLVPVVVDASSARKP
jgi:hypothetical protein